MLFGVSVITIGAWCLLCGSTLVRHLYSSLNIFLQGPEFDIYLYDFYTNLEIGLLCAKFARSS